MVSEDAQAVDERGTNPVRNRTEFSIANLVLPILWFLSGFDSCWLIVTSRKHLRTKVTPDFYLTYSKNWGNLGSKSK